jgi:hypothetical protein
MKNIFIQVDSLTQNNSQYIIEPNIIKTINFKTVTWRTFDDFEFCDDFFYVYTFFFIVIFYCCTEWRYTVASPKVLTLYQLYHTWIYPLHYFPLFPATYTPGILSMNIIYPLQSRPSTAWAILPVLWWLFRYNMYLKYGLLKTKLLRWTD